MPSRRERSPRGESHSRASCTLSHSPRADRTLFADLTTHNTWRGSNSTSARRPRVRALLRKCRVTLAPDHSTNLCVLGGGSLDVAVGGTGDSGNSCGPPARDGGAGRCSSPAPGRTCPVEEPREVLRERHYRADEATAHRWSGRNCTTDATVRRRPLWRTAAPRTRRQACSCRSPQIRSVSLVDTVRRRSARRQRTSGLGRRDHPTFSVRRWRARRRRLSCRRHERRGAAPRRDPSAPRM